VSQSALPKLLAEIYACRRCPNVIASEVARTIQDRWNAKLVLMAQAPSEHGVRTSGIHWVDSNGHLRPPGGTYLNGYLRQIGYSIDPEQSSLPRPYTTNVVQCWPGKRGKRDRPPTETETRECRRWWAGEFELLRPQAVLLLGRPAANALAAAAHLDKTFESLLEAQGVQMTYPGGKAAVYTVPHPTAPYKGLGGGRSYYYDAAFTGLRKLFGASDAASRSTSSRRCT